jgi:hypothetical protein
MGSLGPTHLISLLLAVAIIVAACGWMDGGRDPARKASPPERARSRRLVR